METDSGRARRIAPRFLNGRPNWCFVPLESIVTVAMDRVMLEATGYCHSPAYRTRPAKGRETA
jgi:hypothetical protein